MKTLIATTPEQSKRLLACGVKPETADMSYQYIDECTNNSDLPICNTPKEQFDFLTGHGFGSSRIHITSAWSLSALLALLPDKIDGYWITIQKNDTVSKWGLAYMKCKYDNKLKSFETHSVGKRCTQISPTPIEACVKAIEWLTANGYSLNNIEQ